MTKFIDFTNMTNANSFQDVAAAADGTAPGEMALVACEMFLDAYESLGLNAFEPDLDDAAEQAEAALVLAGRRERRMSKDLLRQITANAAARPVAAR